MRAGSARAGSARLFFLDFQLVDRFTDRGREFLDLFRARHGTGTPAFESAIIPGLDRRFIFGYAGLSGGDLLVDLLEFFVQEEGNEILIAVRPNCRISCSSIR